MDAFTITDDKGTASFDGTQMTITPVDGSAVQTYTLSGTVTPPATDTPVSGTVVMESGAVFNSTFTAA